MFSIRVGSVDWRRGGRVEVGCEWRGNVMVCLGRELRVYNRALGVMEARFMVGQQEAL